MNPEHVRILVGRRLEEAKECLEDGRALLSANRGARTAVNRAYYAAFYAVLALLQTVGKTPRKHHGVLELFDSDFVRTGLLPAAASEEFHRLFEARLEDDYRRLDPISLEEAADLLSVAEGFLAAVRRYLADTGHLPRQ